jgi:hypothetical protein
VACKCISLTMFTSVVMLFLCLTNLHRYFPLEHFFMTMVPENAGASGNFFAGTLAGCGNALILNPISAVKYKTWSRDVNRGMLNEIVSMFRQGGLRPFLNGLQPTILRDVSFGGVYTYLRLELQWAGVPPDYQWVSNMMAAGIATVVSGPFNLARNEQYAVRSFQKAPTIAQVLAGFIKEVKEIPSTFEKCHHIQSRLRIGYGTLRVAVGMAFGHHVYDTAMLQYESHKAEFHVLEERLHLIPAREGAIRRVEGDGESGNPS